MLWPVLTAAALLSAVSDTVGAPHWQVIESGWSPTGQIVNDTGSTSVIRFAPSGCSPAAACNLVAIQTGPISSDTQLRALLDDDSIASTLEFSIHDDQAGSKTRLEATSCYVTPADLIRDGLDPESEESQQLQALHFIYQNCSGAAAAPNASVATWTNLSYYMLLPPSFQSSSQAIMGQFHGRPDPRIFFNPRTNETKRLDTADAYAACLDPEKKHGNCNEGEVYGTGPYSGWKYKQGGYPPLTFGYATNATDAETAVPSANAGYFYVYGRSDNRLFVPKADCSFNPNKHWPTRSCPGGSNEWVNGIWRVPFSAFPLGKWLKFDWAIKWSAYAPEGGSTLADGVVSLTIKDGDDSVAAVHWTGPLGRHDDGRAPFFKMGDYDPSGNTDKVQVSYRGFTQSYGIVT